jgi:hypothetical protein
MVRLQARLARQHPTAHEFACSAKAGQRLLGKAAPYALRITKIQLAPSTTGAAAKTAARLASAPPLQPLKLDRASVLAGVEPPKCFWRKVEAPKSRRGTWGATLHPNFLAGEVARAAKAGIRWKDQT